MEIFKISSGEITNKPLIQHIASKKKSIILSTGMSHLGEVEKAIGWINEIWDKDKPLNHPPTHPLINPLTILHCVSSYPARIEDANLNAMKTMETAFMLPVGYSDHTMGIEMSIAAVAMGAKVIEKHFTIDRGMLGPDHRASLEPEELKSMVNAIRKVERAFGDGIKRPVKSEENTKGIARRSLIAARDIKEGEIISPGDLKIKRPGTGIPPEFRDVVIGMRIKKDLGSDTVINWENLKDA
jgi:sialic acid synthase SpsE